MKIKQEDEFIALINVVSRCDMRDMSTRPGTTLQLTWTMTTVMRGRLMPEHKLKDGFGIKFIRAAATNASMWPFHAETMRQDT